MLEDRTAKYAVEMFKYLRERPYDVSTKVIAHQLGKSASSIGANYHEANRSESRDDFVHKVAIAVKEANESGYWSRFLEGCVAVTKGWRRRQKRLVNCGNLHEKADRQIARMCVEYRNQGVRPVDFDGIADGCDCVSWQG